MAKEEKKRKKPAEGHSPRKEGEKKKARSL